MELIGAEVVARTVGEENGKKAVGASVATGSEAVGALIGPVVGVAVLRVSIVGAIGGLLLGACVGLTLLVVVGEIDGVSVGLPVGL